MTRVLLGLVIAWCLLGQDVFSSGDRKKTPAKPSRQPDVLIVREPPPENPCKSNRSMKDCGAFYYNPTEAGSLDNAKNQCFRFCAKYGGPGPACECYTVPDRGGAGGAASVSGGGGGPVVVPRTDPVRPQAPVPERGRVKDATAPDPANPSPLRLYGGVSQSDKDGQSSKGNGGGSRFGVGNINDADPPLLVTAQLLAGIDDCLKENLLSDIAFMPLTIAAQRYRGLKSLMLGFGLVGSPATLVHDIQATMAPGQSLADRSYEIGRLLCDGYQLKDLLNPHKSPLVDADGPGLAPVRPKGEAPAIPPGLGRPKPAYEDPLVQGTLARGIPLVDHKALQAMAVNKGLNIVVRDSSPYAMKWVGHPDAVSKAVDVKAKTLKPPSQYELAGMSAAEKAREKLKEPYYGLVSAHGMSSGEISLLQLKGYKVDDPSKGMLIRTAEGKMIHSDIDLHGMYDQAGNDAWPKSAAGEQILLREMNETTLVRMFQHGPQDNFLRRNDPKGPSYGPQPPATVYTHDGRVLFADSIASLRGLYQDLGIAWEKIYPGH
jgi:hypothetical protein